VILILWLFSISALMIWMWIRSSCCMIFPYCTCIVFLILFSSCINVALLIDESLLISTLRISSVCTPTSDVVLTSIGIVVVPFFATWICTTDDFFILMGSINFSLSIRDFLLVTYFNVSCYELFSTFNFLICVIKF
jgi:hypothetical protein